MSSLARKFDRASAMGWTRDLPKWCGPCTFIRTPRKERRDLMANLRRIRAGYAWAPVGGVKEVES